MSQSEQTDPTQDAAKDLDEGLSYEDPEPVVDPDPDDPDYPVPGGDTD